MIIGSNPPTVEVYCRVWGAENLGELPDVVDNNDTGTTTNSRYSVGGNRGGSKQLSLKEAVLVWKNDKEVANGDRAATNAIYESDRYHVPMLSN